MHIQEKIRVINQIEAKGFDEFTFDEVNWWPLIRIYLFENHNINDSRESSKNDLKKSSKIELGYFKRVLWDLRVLKGIFYKKKKLNVAGSQIYKKCDYAFVSNSNNYKLNFEKKWINRYIDPLFIETKEKKNLFIRGTKYIDNEYVVNSAQSIDYLEQKLLFKKQYNLLLRTVFFLKEREKYSVLNIERITEIIKYLKEYSELNNFNFNKLSDWIDIAIYHSEIATILFGKVTPSVFIQYCYYFPMQFGYNLAASSMKIISVDYQHGNQNKWHYGYGSWKNVPNNGFSILPNEFWVYSEREKNNLLKGFKSTPHEVLVKGNYWFNYWRGYKLNNDKLNWVLDKKSEGKKVILFTVSSYLLDRDNFFWEYLKTSQDEKTFWLFRLHPAYLNLEDDLKLILKECGVSFYNIKEATNVELYDLLNIIDLHITQNSSVAEEALSFGLKTIILEQEWSLYFEDYLNEGKMVMPKSVKEFSEILNLYTD